MRLIRNIHKEAVKLNACKKFTGEENFDEIVELLFSPQGIEFCTDNNFPDLEYFEQVLNKNPRNKGIYINAGTVELNNIKTVLLVGDTKATLNYSGVERAYQVILMHGASVKINADNYAVVFVHGEKENVVTNIKNNALVK